jgi:ribonuclease HII
MERELHAGGAQWVIGCDEVGRGAIAGPVSVGMVVVDAEIGPAPEGLRDSKLLAEPRREALAPLCSSWARFSAVGSATADEIDRLGIIECLGLAASRALAELEELGAPLSGSTVLLDGKHDWLSPRLAGRLPVITRIKADRDCVSVAAASVVAKVHRDRLMIELDSVVPGYSWASNKGYGSAEHYAGIDSLGPSPYHRLSWIHEPPALFGSELLEVPEA